MTQCCDPALSRLSWQTANIMLHFTRSLEIEESVLPKILEDISPCSGREINLRVVGQEQNHVLLLAWDDLLPFSSPKKLVSYIGSFHPTTKTFAKLYTFENKVSIRQCSLSQDGSLIAYTTYSDAQRRYSAFLAEVHNRIRTCIYSLNLQHDSLIQVKFLWPHRNVSSTDHLARESKLLVFLHNKSIGLYTINLRRTGSSMVLHKLPIAEQVCGRFFWAQWDKLGQRLYVLTAKRSKSGKTRNIFKCLEFSSGGKIPASPVMVMELPFNIKERHYAERCGPYDDPLSDIIAGESLNMQVVTQSHGVFCICYQHVLQRQRRLKKTISSPILGSSRPHAFKLRVSVPEFDTGATIDAVPLAIPMSPTELRFDLMSFPGKQRGTTHVDVAYSIFCVHSCSLISAVAHGVPLEKARGMKLFFGPQDGYVLVYSPGVVQHLVNVTSEFPPCHHLALNPEMEGSKPGGTGGSGAIADRLGVMTCGQPSRGTCIYDITNRVAYQYSWMKQQPFYSLYPSLAESVLHYVNIQARDYQLREEIMSHLTQDPTDLGLWQIFIAFIVSSTYAAIRKQVDDRDILQNFPFTTALSKPQLVTSGDGEKVATFSSKSCPCKVEISEEAIQQKFSHPIGNPYLFSRLKTHITDLKEGSDTVRYSMKGLRERIDQLMEEDMPIAVPTPSKEEVQSSPQMPNSTLKRATESIKKKLTISGRRRRKSPSPAAKEPSVAPVQTEDEWRYDRINEAHIDALQGHLQEQLTHMSSEKLLQIATAYCNCQVQQVQQLINILVRSVGLEDKGEHNVWDTSLNTRGSDQEQLLFMMMERLFVAMETHCLQSPRDFPTQFTCLGFRCLDFPTFLDYLRNGALQLTKTFLQKLLRDLPDDDEANRAMKMKLIDFLSTEDPVLANELLVSWNHPEGNAALTKLYLEQSWFSDTSRADAKDHEQPESPAARFPPLVSLLKYTQKLGREPSTSSSPNQGIWMPSSKIASAALFNSMQEYGEDLRGFTF